MSYTNVVFKQNITRNVNRDEIERQRLDDRGMDHNSSHSWFSSQVPNCRQSHLQAIRKIHPSRQL